jgi:hypothetical protein
MAWFCRVVVCVLVIGGPSPARAQAVDPGGAPSTGPCDETAAWDAGLGCVTSAGRTIQGTTPDRPASPKRILGIIPNFTTTDDTFQESGPLAPHNKFVLGFDQMFDVSAHLGNLLQAGVQQATAGQPHYVVDSFAKRLAAAEVDQISSCLFIYAVLPTLLRTDPRYFRRQEGPAASRAWYAVSRTFVARTDAGAHVLNTPQLAGQLTQAGLSNLYYPEQDRTWQGTMTNWAIQLAYNSAFNVVKEFYPDVVARLHHHHMTP